MWVCEVAVSTCCEDWLGQLDLLLFPSPTAGAGAALDLPLASSSSMTPPHLPFATLPFVFPNPATHFGPQFNANRSTLLTLPPAFAHARVFALVTGHGSDPPPPVGQGCEYAPTEHVFYLGAPGGSAPLLALNTSLAAPQQYLLAGSIFGCSDKVPLGVLGNQHGDWRDGRNGWCPGQGVAPVLSADIASALAGLPVVQVTYQAFSFYTDLTNRSLQGCGGDIQWSAALLLY